MITDDNINRMMEPDPQKQEQGWRIVSMDDLPPAIRACRLASMANDRAHKNNCPSCLEHEAVYTLQHAGEHLIECDEEGAFKLIEEAKAIRERAHRLRIEKVESSSSEPSSERDPAQ